MNYQQKLNLQYPPTKQQVKVLEWIENSDSNKNGVLSAVAGGGKTSMLSMITKLIKKNKLGTAIYLAFNKAIVNEAQSKFDCEVATLHSLGYTVLKNTYGYVKVDTKKVSTLVNDYRKKWSNDYIQYEYNYTIGIKKVISLAKLNLVLPSNLTPTIIDNFINDYNITFQKDVINSPNERAELHKRIKAIYKKVLPSSKPRSIDFDDMVFLPAIQNLQFPQYDFVLIDECQDLNNAQREFMLKLRKKEVPQLGISGGKFLSVGDKFQAIYKFAGADSKSYESLCNVDNTDLLELSYTFRCGKKIVEFAQKYVPHIKAFDYNGDGNVEYEGSISNVKDNDMILCRINAPLIQLCLQFIADGRKANVRGKDIGLNLINLIKSFKLKTNDLNKLHKALENEIENSLKELRIKFPHLEDNILTNFESYINLEDKVDAIYAISETVRNTKQVIDKINQIFSDDNKEGILLSTIHKAKGLENDRVHILHFELMEYFYTKNTNRGTEASKEFALQENNLAYVAITRAKENLSLITDWTANSRIVKLAGQELSDWVDKKSNSLMFNGVVVDSNDEEMKLNKNLD